jgi:hypothetical protein
MYGPPARDNQHAKTLSHSRLAVMQLATARYLRTHFVLFMPRLLDTCILPCFYTLDERYHPHLARNKVWKCCPFLESTRYDNSEEKQHFTLARQAASSLLYAANLGATLLKLYFATSLGVASGSKASHRFDESLQMASGFANKIPCEA